MVTRFENIFSFDDLKRIREIILKPNWGWGHRSNTHKDDTNLFWKLGELEKDTWFSEYLLAKIENITGDKLEVISIYMNGETACQQGMPHIDGDNEKGRTFLVYLTENFKMEHGGGTVFFSDDGEDSVTIPYKYNTAVYFKNNITHCAAPISRYFNGLRVSLAFKLLKK